MGKWSMTTTSRMCYIWIMTRKSILRADAVQYKVDELMRTVITTCLARSISQERNLAMCWRSTSSSMSPYSSHPRQPYPC